MKRVLLYGGGLESTLLFFTLKALSDPFEALIFNYGQKTWEQELEAARYFCEQHDVRLRLQEITYLKGLTWNGSCLFGTSDNHVVDGRNLYFVMEALKRYDQVFIGSHQNDTAPDASEGYLEALTRVVELSFRGEKTVQAPLYYEDLRRYLREAEKQEPLLLDRIFSCWTPEGGRPCGKCKHCRKIESFR